MKYMIYAFNYPYTGYDISKQTIAALWFMLFSIKYDGVDIQKRN